MFCKDRRVIAVKLIDMVHIPILYLDAYAPCVYWLFQIRRPYFHVKPLEKSQLKNWRSYLEFEIANGSEKRVTVLFERCVIACALYEEFWMKVCQYLLCACRKCLTLFSSYLDLLISCRVLWPLWCATELLMFLKTPCGRQLTLECSRLKAL